MPISLLLMDIVVQLEDGSIANLEVQRIGYAFPGQRSACYSADLLLRQYKRVNGELGRNFNYRDIQKVFSIVLIEKSTKDFHKFEDIYLHHSQQKTDSGLKIDLLQEYDFIALDIFRKKLQNNGIEKNNRLEAWLAFLCEDNPELILELIKVYPDFEAIYKEVYEMCLDTERMMGIFSKELEVLDKNTVQYMIDEMQDTIDEQKVQLTQKDAQLIHQKVQLSQKDSQLTQKDLQIKLGIHAFILDNLEENIPRERILLKLQKRFNLSPENAEVYFRDATENKNL